MDVGEQARGDRRGDLRWEVRGRPPGRMTPLHKATYHTVSLVDISMGGALIEHSTKVGPGTPAFLTLLIHMVHGWEAGLMCQVVRSVVDRYDVDPTGKRDLVYRTGLKFLAPSEVSRRVIVGYIADRTIDSLRRGKKRQHADG